LLSTTIITLPWLPKRTRLLPNACLFPKSRVAKHSYEVIMLSCHHTCMYLMPSTQLSKVCCCRTVVYIQQMLGHHASTLGTTQTHGTVLLVASGMLANRSKDINVLLVWLCQEWNQSSSSADCVNVTEMVDPNMPKRQLHSLHQCNLSQTSHFGQSFYWISSIHDAIDWNAAAAENAGYIESLYDQTLLRCKSRLRHDTPILRQQCTGGVANASKTIVQLVSQCMRQCVEWCPVAWLIWRFTFMFQIEWME
jgi:hypothetical protein